MTAPIIFMDTETTGLDPDRHIWEFAAIRRDPDGTEEVYEVLVEHDTAKAMKLPPSFKADYDARFRAVEAIAARHLVGVVHYACRSDTGAPYADRPHIVGAVPNFDTERIAQLMRFHGVEPTWHHHIIDAETLAIGWLRGRYGAVGIQDLAPFPEPPWDSDALSKAIGIDPGQFARHTALGDVRWAMAIYNRVMG